MLSSHWKSRLFLDPDLDAALVATSVYGDLVVGDVGGAAPDALRALRKAQAVL